MSKRKNDIYAYKNKIKNFNHHSMTYISDISKAFHKLDSTSLWPLYATPYISGLWDFRLKNSDRDQHLHIFVSKHCKGIYDTKLNIITLDYTYESGQ